MFSCLHCPPTPLVFEQGPDVLAARTGEQPQLSVLASSSQRLQHPVRINTLKPLLFSYRFGWHRPVRVAVVRHAPAPIRIPPFFFSHGCSSTGLLASRRASCGYSSLAVDLHAN